MAGVVEIELNQGMVALVDSRDAGRVSSRKWFANQSSSSKHLFYAMRQEGGKTIYMHRFILCAPSGVYVDHINGNGLDNRRCNLRLASNSQNSANRNKGAKAASGYKGVYLAKGRYRARIMVNYRNLHLGAFDDPVRAAIAYDEAATKHFGEFARLNFPRPGRPKKVA